MIISVDKAILHILDANSGITVFSDKELETDDTIFAFISKHIEKVYPDSGLRYGCFNDNSGFKFHLSEYLEEHDDMHTFSTFIGERLYEAVYGCDKPASYDVLVCDCKIDDVRTICILLCENKMGYTHQVQQADGVIRNEIINHYAILPSENQKISECAFINTEDLSIKFRGKKRKIDGEPADLMSDILLECSFDLSTKESFTKMQKFIREVAEENSLDATEAIVKVRDYVTDSVAQAQEDMKIDELAETVFSDAPALKEEFSHKLEEAQIPEKVEINEFVTKKVNSNVKIVTDTGIELSFPAEYYRDSEYIEIVNNDDGTLSIKLNNIGAILNKN